MRRATAALSNVPYVRPVSFLCCMSESLVTKSANDGGYDGVRKPVSRQAFAKT